MSSNLQIREPGQAEPVGFLAFSAAKLPRRFALRRAFALATLALVVACSGSVPWSSSNGPVGELTMPMSTVDAELEASSIQISDGWLVGYKSSGLRVFKGIPYAAPPVGLLRWKPPQPANPWSTPRVAQSFGFDCLQNRPEWDEYQSAMAMSEDCLTLNIWTPASESETGKLPVMVFIHGGGFVIGSSSQPVADGAALASRGAVIVTFNYRLGRFGFFSHPELTAESKGQAVANFGVMDQMAALRWVRDNISAFGGDPANVTIFGESAGGASVAHMMVAEPAQGLFHRAIIQSGGGRLRWGSFKPSGEDRGAEAAGLAFVKRLKLGNLNLEELRGLSAEEILGDVSFSKLRSKTYSGPVIDERLIKAEFIELFEKGVQAKVPLLIGANSAELSHMGTLPEFFIRRAIKKGLKPHLTELKSVYGSWKNLDEKIVNHWGFVEPARTMAASHAAQDAHAYLYEFDYVLTSQADALEGAPHASELPFVFDTLESVEASPSATDRVVADRMADTWVAFAATGMPQRAGDAPWQAYDPELDLRTQITASGVSARPVTDAAALDRLASIGRAQP